MDTDFKFESEPGGHKFHARVKVCLNGPSTGHAREQAQYLAHSDSEQAQYVAHSDKPFGDPQKIVGFF